MTKKRKQPTLEETLDRPWCFYCERDFDDQKVLASHQKAKHFRCKNCNRRLNTIGGLAVHLSQVHKENLDAVEDALPNRNNIQLEIFGMEGVPQDIIDQHRQRIIREYTELHGHRQSTNNQGAANASKKPKIETKEEIKARLAAFKAKKAAGELPGSAANGSETPTQVEVEKPTLVVPYDHGPGGPQSPAPFQGGVPGLPYPAASGHIQMYQPGSEFQPTGFQPPGYQPPYQPYGQGHYGPPMQPQPQPQQNMHLPPFGQPFPPSFSPSPGSFNGRPGGSPFSPPNGTPYALPPSFNPPGQISPPPGSSLPTAPGLPRRPAFQPPEMSASQFQQLHHGQQYEAGRDPRNRPQKNPASRPSHTEADVDQLIADGAAFAAKQEEDRMGQVPNLKREEDRTGQVQNLKREEDEDTFEQNRTTMLGSAEHNPEIKIEADEQKPKIKTEPSEHDGTLKSKSSKKSKNENFVLMYSDTEHSPEEKMAALSRYAFDPKKQADDTTLETTTEAVGANFTGAVVGEDDVIDTQGD